VLRIALKGLLARKLRLFTTSLAVLLGVAFMAGTLVLTDTIGRTFDSLFADVTAGTDAVVRGKSAVTSDFETVRDRVPTGLLDAVRAVPGVAATEGFVEGYTQIVGRDGKAVGNPGMGAPTFGRNWPTVAALNSFRLVEGRAPTSDDEVVLDKYTAGEAGVAVGGTATVLVQDGPRQVRVVGIAKFGDADGTAGATQVMFTSAAAQRLIAEPGYFDSIAVVAAGDLSQRELRDRLDQALPDDAEVITGEQLTEENQSAIRRALRFFNGFLITFAVIALLVGAFMIYNTFSIIIAQRARETALMRAIGASRRQVLAEVVVEATAVGLVASVLGMFAGIGIAALLKGVLAAFGIDIPAGGVVFSAKTAVTSLVAGVGVCVASAYFPARRASKVPPVAAMRDLAYEQPGGFRRRTIVGAVVTALGAALLLAGLFGDSGNRLANVGLGATVVFFGVAVLGPVVARPVARVVGAPLPRLRGVTGTLARENALRNPKRTASTAAALMIGVGLVGFITIFAASTKTSINRSIDRAFTGDFVIDSGTFGFGGLSPELAKALKALPEVRAVSGLRFGQAEVDGSTQFVGALNAAEFSTIFDLDIAEGSLADLRGDTLAVSSSTARDKGWHAGDTVEVTFAETGERTLRIAAVYRRADAVGLHHVLPLDSYEANFARQFDARVFVSKAAGVTAGAARRAVEAVTDKYANATLQDQTEYKEAQAAQINQMLGLIYVMLFLAILIAFLGIMNTLALSIFERTRELGLLRAVGMTRRQLRSAIRWESVIIALFGTLLGLVIGLFFGWALVQALRNEGIIAFTVPVGQIVTIVVVGALAGIGAAVLPGRRAARLDVLRAITTE
jgi:putative ABC transport system permease protein